jgi:hypothetical protein
MEGSLLLELTVAWIRISFPAFTENRKFRELKELVERWGYEDMGDREGKGEHVERWEDRWKG